MNIQDYSQKALTTLADNHAIGDISPTLLGQLLGLIGESGEIAEKVKKLIRDKSGRLTDDDKKELAKEIGDVLWYVNSIGHELGYTLDEIAQMNLDKVLSRKDRGVIEGSGDNR